MSHRRKTRRNNGAPASRSRSGYRASLKGKHGQAEARIELDDVVAATAVALGAGGAGLLWFEPVTTIGGLALMAAGLTYFGVKYGD